MKYLKSLTFLFVTLTLLLACSSNDDDNNNNGPTVGDYFPSTANNTWTYDVDNESDTHSEIEFQNETDFLKVDAVTGNTFTLDVNNGNPAYGSMNDILSVGSLTIGESTLKYSGTLQLPEEFSSISNQTLAVDNILLYDLNASNNSTMSEITGTIEESFELNDGSVPIYFDYIITTKKISFQNSMTINGETYSNIVKTRLTLNINVYATFPVFGNMTIISNQDVIVIDNYFAEDVGLIKSETTQEYQVNQAFLDILESLSPPVELGVATEFHMHNVQKLNDYIVE